MFFTHCIHPFLDIVPFHLPPHFSEAHVPVRAFQFHSLDGDSLNVIAMEESMVAGGGARCLVPHHVQHGT